MRPAGAVSRDQQCVATLAAALRNGADYPAFGRQLTRTLARRAEVEKTFEENGRRSAERSVLTGSRTFADPNVV